MHYTVWIKNLTYIVLLYSTVLYVLYCAIDRYSLKLRKALHTAVPPNPFFSAASVFLQI